MARTALGVLCVALWALCGSALARESKRNPSMQFERRTHDFGEVYRGEKLTYRFGFINEGDAPLVIQGVHAACGCTVALAESGKQYAPGERGYVEVHFDTTDFVGPISKIVTVMSNEKLIPDRALTVRALVKSEVETDPPLVDFGDVFVQEEAERRVKIKPIGGFPLDVSGVQFDEKLLEVQLGARLSAGDYELKVRLRKELLPQFVKTLITVKTNSTRLADLPIPIRAAIKGTVDVTPAYIEFGAVSAHGHVRRAVTLRGPAEAFEVKGHRVELNVNGRAVEGGTGLVKVTTKDLGAARRKASKAVTIDLANDSRFAGSVHGKLYLQTTDATQREIAVDFYAFFR